MSIKFRLFRNTTGQQNDKPIALLKKDNDTIKQNDVVYGLEFIDQQRAEQSPYGDSIPHIKFYKDTITSISNNNITYNRTNTTDIFINTNGNSGNSAQDHIKRLITDHNTTFVNKIKNAVEYIVNSKDIDENKTIRDNFVSLLNNQGKNHQPNAFSYLQAYKNTL